MVGGIIPLRRATSSRYDGRLEQESAGKCLTFFFEMLFAPNFAVFCPLSMSFMQGIFVEPAIESERLRYVDDITLKAICEAVVVRQPPVESGFPKPDHLRAHPGSY
jgi:hypothetical protein